jgi:hypothetical protein
VSWGWEETVDARRRMRRRRRRRRRRDGWMDG